MAVIKNISPAASLSDEELLYLFKKDNDQQHLSELFLRYYEMLYGIALKYLSDADAAKDAVMNMYSELLQKLPQQNIQVFRNWLYVFARNHCLMQLRKDKKMPLVLSNDEQLMQLGGFLHPDNDNEKEKLLNKLEDCVKTLLADQRKSVELFYLHSKSYNEIAAQTGLEWSKVRSLIQNGRRNLKICMEKNNEP